MRNKNVSADIQKQAEKVHCFPKSQEERPKPKVRHNRTRVPRMPTVRLEERPARHGQPTASAGDHRCRRLAHRARPDIREPCRADTCTPGRTARTGSGRRRRASAKSGAGTESDTVRQSTAATPLHRVSSSATHALHQWDVISLYKY